MLSNAIRRSLDVETTHPGSAGPGYKVEGKGNDTFHLINQFDPDKAPHQQQYPIAKFESGPLPFKIKTPSPMKSPILLSPLTPSPLKKSPNRTYETRQPQMLLKSPERAGVNTAGVNTPPYETAGVNTPPDKMAGVNTTPTNIPCMDELPVGVNAPPDRPYMDEPPGVNTPPMDGVNTPPDRPYEKHPRYTSPELPTPAPIGPQKELRGVAQLAGSKHPAPPADPEQSSKKLRTPLRGVVRRSNRKKGIPKRFHED